MVVQEDHRASVRRDLDGAQDHALAGQFARRHPLERRPLGAQADAVAVRRDAVGGRGEGAQGRGREPVGAGTQADRQDQFGRRCGPGRGAGQRYRPRGDAHRDDVPVPQGLGAEPRQQVRGAAAQDALGGDAPRDGHVRADAPGHRPHVQDRAGRDPHRGAPGDRPAVERHRAGRTADHDGDVPVGAQGAAGQSGLQDGGVRCVAEEAVGEPHRGGVERAGAGDAQVGVARPARVLHRRERPGTHRRDRGRHAPASAREPADAPSSASPPSTVTNRTRVPGVRRAARSRAGSHSGRGSGIVPMSCQPPGVARG